MIKIRKARNEEVPFIREQRVNAYQKYESDLPNEHWNALKQAISSEADKAEGVELLVAESEGELMGSIALFPSNSDAYEGYIDELDYPEIRMLAVAPNFQGKGIASALITECENLAKQKGYRYIGLHTGEFMTNAISLYEKKGYKRMPEFDFEPADDGIMVKAFKKAL